MISKWFKILNGYCKKFIENDVSRNANRKVFFGLTIIYRLIYVCMFMHKKQVFRILEQLQDPFVWVKTCKNDM